MVYLLVDEIAEKYGSKWVEKYRDESGAQLIEKIFGWPENNVYVVVREEKQRKKIQKELEKELKKIREEFGDKAKSVKIKAISTQEYNKKWKNVMRIM
ncbi:MAG: hypothetical protein QXL86_03140 [Candidatus Aenigmatarchaeota archaeon]